MTGSSGGSFRVKAGFEMRETRNACNQEEREAESPGAEWRPRSHGSSEIPPQRLVGTTSVSVGSRSTNGPMSSRHRVPRSAPSHQLARVGPPEIDRDPCPALAVYAREE